MGSATDWLKMTRFSRSIRFQFIAALLGATTLIAAGFSYAVYEMVEVFESYLMEHMVKHELRGYAEQFRIQPSAPLPTGNDIRSYVLRAGEPPPPGFPPWLSSWPAGQYQSFDTDEKEYYVGREDVGDARLFLILDIENVERLESRLIWMAVVAITLAWAGAIAAGILLARAILRPISRLAENVARLDPGDTTVRVGNDHGDPEVGRIAAAIDTYLQRLDEFVTRERAFTDEASHELRTPLAVVRSAVHLLREEPNLGDRSRARLARIERAARQMEDLIEAMLFLAREDGGWNDEPCALDEVLENVASTYRVVAAEKALTLHCEIVERSTIMMPPGMAECIVSNLVANAIRNTETGRIDVRLDKGRIVVQDSGSGIAFDELQQIFRRHFRGAQSRGLGLGLYLVKRICDRLGWTISVQSAPGAGARFDVTFVPPT